MQTIQLKSLQFQQKSKKKAGEGKVSGLYKFFTSSSIQKNFVDEADFVGPALIFGTGGSANIHFCDENFSTSTDCFILKADNKEIDLKYIYYFLSGNISILEQGFKGAGLKHISKEYLGEIEISLPPLSTQKQIISKLDTLSNLINLKKEQIKKQENLTKSIFIEMFGDPMINEKGWEVKKLEELSTFISGGTPSRTNEDFFKGNIPWITTTALGKIYISKENANEFITEEAVKKSATKLIFKNSILIGVRVGVGKVSINKDDICFSQDIIGITNISKILNILYLREFLNYKNEEYQDNKRGATIQGITSGIIKNTLIFLPPISLQNKFASIVEKNEEIIAKQKESLKKLEELYNGVMQESFRV